MAWGEIVASLVDPVLGDGGLIDNLQYSAEEKAADQTQRQTSKDNLEIAKYGYQGVLAQSQANALTAQASLAQAGSASKNQMIMLVGGGAILLTAVFLFKKK